MVERLTFWVVFRFVRAVYNFGRIPVRDIQSKAKTARDLRQLERDTESGRFTPLELERRREQIQRQIRRNILARALELSGVPLAGRVAKKVYPDVGPPDMVEIVRVVQRVPRPWTLRRELVRIAGDPLV